jgi:hypothetical protein
VVVVLGLTMLVLGANKAAAQGPALPLSKAIVSDDVAKRTLMKMQINAATARAIVDACVEFARASNASYSNNGCGAGRYRDRAGRWCSYPDPDSARPANEHARAMRLFYRSVSTAFPLVRGLYVGDLHNTL